MSPFENLPAGPADYLGTFSGSGAVITGTISDVQRSYGALVINCVSNTAGAFPAGATVQGFTTNPPTPAAPFARYPSPGGSSNLQGQAIVGCIVNPGGALQVAAYLTAIAASAEIWVYGLTDYRPPMRADGRAFPLGRFHADNASASAVPVTVIPAPISPLSIMLAHALFTSSGAGGTMTATMNGAAANLVRLAAAGNLPLDLPPGGLLLDAGTALTIAGGTSITVAATVEYDLVP